MPADSKEAWRTWAKAVRSELPLAELNARLIAGLKRWPRYQEARHLLSYLAFGSELDMGGLDASGKKVYVTRTVDSRHLTIHSLQEGLERHPLGFLQPPLGSPEVNPAIIDLALVPGLCFDERGTRLGYGLGYYDRLLPRLRSDALLVGVTASALVVPALPREAYDVPMTHLLTESGIVITGKERGA